jgi:hypothetical protein
MTGPGQADPTVESDRSAHVVGLDPLPASSCRARQFVSGLVEEWGLGSIIEEATLCATELATNAILHSNGRFVVTVRTIGAGIRIEVMDASPHQIPWATPRTGTASDLTAMGQSGRGLQIVSALATRWGVFTTAEAKTIWVELDVGHRGAPSEPILVLDRTDTQSVGAIRLRYLRMPTRAAVGSGIQVEDVIRGIQLERDVSQQPDETIGRLFELLDRTASIRLAGRHAALRASARQRARFDLALRAEVDALVALGELSRFLRDVGDLLSVPVSPAADAVLEFREWLNEETARQQAGERPTPCPLEA